MREETGAGVNTSHIVEKAREVLRHYPQVKLLYLFGSQVEDKTGPMSDYDFGVFVDPAQPTPDLEHHLSHRLALALQADKVDVVPLNRAPIELAYAVIAQGRLLYEADITTRVEYEAQVLSRYFDYLPVLRAQRGDLLYGEPYGTRVRRHRAAAGRVDSTLAAISASQRKATP